MTGHSAQHQHLPPQQQPWQDEHGTWHYPYDAHAQPAPPLTVARPMQPVRDPRRTALAATITFICLVMGLWAILGFLSEMSETLGNVQAGNVKIQSRLVNANKGLVDLEEKTSNLTGLSENTKTLRTSLEGIDSDMGAMLESVNKISEAMSSMDSSLGTLDTELTTVNSINGSLGGKLGTINSGLAKQRSQVATMRSDVVATGAVLNSLGPQLTATNSRLAHVNGVVCFMGDAGITNNLNVKIKLGPIPNGSAEVFATVVPAGAWTC